MNTNPAKATNDERTVDSTGPGETRQEDSANARATTNSLDELIRIRRAIPNLLSVLQVLIRGPDESFPLLSFGQAHKVTQLSSDVVGLADQWFFIGDLHGDFFALHNYLARAESICPDCKICFLGDMVDRGDLPLESLFLLLEWGLNRPRRLAWIAGNHDIALAMNDRGEFTSTVIPSEFLKVLNKADLLRSFREAVGRFFITLAQKLPRAILFPDGLLVTHGGFPLSDLHAQGNATENCSSYLDWLNSDACLQDFTWTRIHRAPKKLPDRYSSGSQYGYRDFEAFCNLKPDWFPVRRMITGHEHPKDGYALHATYQTNPALTLVGFGFDDLRSSGWQACEYYRDTLFFAQGVANELPRVIELRVDRESLRDFFSHLFPQAADNPSDACRLSSLPPAEAPDSLDANVEQVPVIKESAAPT